MSPPRRQLRGVAESLIAGPQYRSAGTIRLAVRPDGFSAVALPLAVHGTKLVLPNDAVEIAGSLRAVAAAAGIVAGPPEGVYAVVDALPPDADLHLDASAVAFINRIHYAGGHALKKVLPDCHPILWPEHFDVAATAADVNYGVSAGDETHQLPYAYVGPWSVPSGPFWNAPFGALHPLDFGQDTDELAAEIASFFDRGRKELQKPP
jgi:hypothetical protein